MRINNTPEVTTIKLYNFIFKTQDKYKKIVNKYAELGQKSAIHNNMISGIILSTA